MLSKILRFRMPLHQGIYRVRQKPFSSQKNTQFKRNGFDNQNYYYEYDDGEYEEDFSDEPYEPNFTLNFDKNGKLLIYKFRSKKNWLAIAIQTVVIGFFGYKLIYKFKERSTLSFILYSIPLMFFLFILKQNFKLASSMCKNIYLLKDGKSFTYTTLINSKQKFVSIENLSRESTKINRASEGFNCAMIDSADCNCLVDLSPGDHVYILDYELLRAVLTGRTINISSNNDEFIDISD